MSDKTTSKTAEPLDDELIDLASGGAMNTISVTITGVNDRERIEGLEDLSERESPRVRTYPNVTLKRG